MSFFPKRERAQCLTSRNEERVDRPIFMNSECFKHVSSAHTNVKRYLGARQRLHITYVGFESLWGDSGIRRELQRNLKGSNDWAFYNFHFE